MPGPIKVSAIVSAYKVEKYLADFLRNVAEQTMRGNMEIVFVHNEPTQREQSLVYSFLALHPDLIQYIVVPRESLAVSTNRAIRAARGEYVCIWNLDDLRTPDSLAVMAHTLDVHPEASFTYGDFMIVTEWLTKKGVLITAPEFNKTEFVQSMHLGPFYMWRRSVCDAIGYWDEQFKCVGDFDFAARLATEFIGQKTYNLLGYYLDEGMGLSTRRGSVLPIERTCVELRFSVYHKLDFLYYFKTKKYRLTEILNDGQWINLSALAPHIGDNAEGKLDFIYGCITYPIRFMQRAFRYLIKRFLKS